MYEETSSILCNLCELLDFLHLIRLEFLSLLGSLFAVTWEVSVEVLGHLVSTATNVGHLVTSLVFVNSLFKDVLNGHNLGLEDFNDVGDGAQVFLNAGHLLGVELSLDVKIFNSGVEGDLGFITDELGAVFVFTCNFDVDFELSEVSGLATVVLTEGDVFDFGGCLEICIVEGGLDFVFGEVLHGVLQVLSEILEHLEDFLGEGSLKVTLSWVSLHVLEFKGSLIVIFEAGDVIDVGEVEEVLDGGTLEEVAIGGEFVGEGADFSEFTGSVSFSDFSFEDLDGLEGVLVLFDGVNEQSVGVASLDLEFSEFSGNLDESLLDPDDVVLSAFDLSFVVLSVLNGVLVVLLVISENFGEFGDES